MRTAALQERRNRQILADVVRTYIETGEPVSSRAVSARFEETISTATIRNVMVELEDSGFLYQPHTSAGRVPTAAAYRFFAQEIASQATITVVDREWIQREMGGATSAAEITERAGHVLAEVSNGLGIVVAPPLGKTVLEHTRMWLLPDGRVLIAGGRNQANEDLSQSELYNPTTDKFSSGSLMNQTRALHTATLLTSGKVLFIGGVITSGDETPTSELYDPVTGAFTYSSTTADTFALVHHLAARGANPSQIARDIYLSNPASKIRLLGIALSNLQTEGDLAWTWVTSEDMDRIGAVAEDCEGVVNYLISIAGVESAVFLREVADASQFRLSIRSKGKLDVAQIAEHFGGGGHRSASGCTIDGPLAVATERILTQLRTGL